VLTASVPDYIYHRLPFFLVMSVAYGLLIIPPLPARFQMWTGLFPVFIRARCRRWFTAAPNPATASTSTGTPAAGAAALAGRPAHLLLIFGSCAAIVYGLFFHTGGLDFRLLNCAWSTWSIWTLRHRAGALVRSPWEEESAEREWFTPRQVVNNVLGLTLFLFLFALGAYLIIAMT